jgi:hypothetical protein
MPTQSSNYFTPLPYIDDGLKSIESNDGMKNERKKKKGWVGMCFSTGIKSQKS